MKCFIGVASPDKDESLVTSSPETGGVGLKLKVADIYVHVDPW